MPSFETKTRVPYSPRQMYDLVADVERYPEFLPLCQALRVRSREQNDEGQVVLVADMTVAYKVINETFTSEVRLDPARPAVDVSYLDGPFHHLENRWLFRPLPGGSEIDFFISYEFRSRLLGVVMGAMFDQAFRRFAEAFEARARQVYGPPAVAASGSGQPDTR